MVKPKNQITGGGGGDRPDEMAFALGYNSHAERHVRLRVDLGGVFSDTLKNNGSGMAKYWQRAVAGSCGGEGRPKRSSKGMKVSEGRILHHLRQDNSK